jgi:hypothetical protein
MPFFEMTRRFPLNLLGAVLQSFAGFQYRVYP